MYYWRQRVPGPRPSEPADDRPTLGLDWGITGRAGGSSTGDFAGLNLGGHVGDDPDAVRANRAAVAASLGVRSDGLVFPAQCHGSDVRVVDVSPQDGGPPADALVTRSTDIALGVLVADCAPVLLADQVAGVVAAVHAGRPGMLAGIVDRALDAMADLGAREVAGVVGPSVCGRCYEVPSAMRDHAAQTSPVSATVSWRGTPAIDVAAGVVDRLYARGVRLHWVPGCTRESDKLFSYRRSGRTGRFAGVVRLTAEEPSSSGSGP